MPDDLNLLTALRQHSQQAFRELFDLYSDRMYRLALGMLQDESEAEDVVQDAFLRFIEGLDEFEGRSQIGTWLYRTVHNLCIDHLRRSRPFQALPEEDDNLPIPTNLVDWSDMPETRLSESEIRERLNGAISGLPRKLSAAFILYELEGLPLKEVASALDISLSAAKVRLHRARLMLRDSLSAHFNQLARRNKYHAP